MDSKANIHYEDRRDSPRVAVRGLEVAVERKKWLFLKDYHECLLKDISQSGIGLIASDLQLNIGQPVQLVLADNRYEYLAEGKVASKQAMEEFDWYGVILDNAPPELDLRIRNWSRVAILQRDLRLKQKSAGKNGKRILKSAITAPAPTADKAADAEDKYRQRRQYERYPVNALSGRIRNWGLANFNRFFDGEIVDVSENGLRFRTREMAFITDTVRVEINDGDKQLRALGNVCRLRSENGHTVFGIQYLCVPVSYGKFIKACQ